MQGRSTVTQLLEFLHHIGFALDRGQQSDITYLDFAKAFDSVSHSRLLLKLHRYGICGQLHEWFKDYLSNRVQRTILLGAISSPLPVLSGVPQGSILGPVLFLIYINDLPSVINQGTSIRIFADDTKCYRTIRDTSDCIALQSGPDRMFKWSILIGVFASVQASAKSLQLLAREIP